MKQYQGKCEKLTDGRPNHDCGLPAVWRYPSMGGGHMRLCAEHGEPHKRYSEQWTGSAWAPHADYKPSRPSGRTT